MELRVLKYFLAVANEENITKAAALLHLTQPTLSRQLMQLEEELGVTLFRRSQHRIILTEEGHLLRRRAQEIIALAEKTAKEFQSTPELRGEISIGCGELESMSLFAKWLHDFQRLHPQITFQLDSGNADLIKTHIEQGLLDLGLLLEPVDISKYDVLRLPVKETWGIYVREDSSLAKKEAVTPRDLAHVPLILTKRERVQEELERWFGRYGGNLQIAARGNLPYNMAQLAREGIGAFLTLRLRCVYEGLTFVPLSPGLESHSLLAWKKSEPFSPAVEALLQYLQTCLLTMTENAE
jgi:DNA-binding transcriptional LysR family regulator